MGVTAQWQRQPAVW